MFLVDLLLDLLVLFLVDVPLKLVRRIWTGFSHALNVKRSAPEEGHTATEYLDAFLFADEDPHTSDSSSPPSILHRQGR